MLLTLDRAPAVPVADAVVLREDGGVGGAPVRPPPGVHRAGVEDAPGGGEPEDLAVAPAVVIQLWNSGKLL